MSNNKEEKIIGTWQIVPMDLSESPKWLFEEENKLSLLNPNDSIIIQGNYNIELKNARYYLIVDSIGYQNGRYLILKHNKEILILQRVFAEDEAPFLRREFVKL